MVAKAMISRGNVVFFWGEVTDSGYVTNEPSCAVANFD